MNQKETFEKVISTINGLGLEYLITGGFAVSFWGKPRTTHDLDILIKIVGKKKPLIKVFRELGFYMSEEGIEDAIRRKSMFNSIHPESDLKIDFWVVDGSVKRIAEFQRRIQKELFGHNVYFISSEDLILTKLEWFKESDSSRHLQDAQGIYEIQKDKLDSIYLKQRAIILGVENLLNILMTNSLNP